MTSAKTRAPSASYLRLVSAHPLRLIRTDSEYDRAVQVLDRLAVRGEDDLDPGESDYLDALTVFVQQYDDQHYPLSRSLTGTEALAALLESSGLSQAGLAVVLGLSEPTTSMIVSGKRPITADHARALGRHFSVDAGLFIRAAPTASGRGQTLLRGKNMTKNEIFIERRPGGGYAVRKAGSERASAICSTRSEAVERARQIAPGTSPLVERVRDLEPGGRDKQRKP